MTTDAAWHQRIFVYAKNMSYPPGYEWDEAKSASNRGKHGVSFDVICEFDWDAALVLPDLRHDYGEARFLAFGPIGRRLHAVVFTVRGSRIRLISLRKANGREIRKYEASIENIPDNRAGRPENPGGHQAGS